MCRREKEKKKRRVLKYRDHRGRRLNRTGGGRGRFPIFYPFRRKGKIIVHAVEANSEKGKSHYIPGRRWAGGSEKEGKVTIRKCLGVQKKKGKEISPLTHERPRRKKVHFNLFPRRRKAETFRVLEREVRGYLLSEAKSWEKDRCLLFMLGDIVTLLLQKSKRKGKAIHLQTALGKGGIVFHLSPEGEGGRLWQKGGTP